MLGFYPTATEAKAATYFEGPGGHGQPLRRHVRHTEGTAGLF